MSSTMMMTCGSQRARIEAERAGAARDDEADVAVAFSLALTVLSTRFGHLLPRQRDFELDGLRAVVEPVDVLVEAKDLAVVDADAFEDAVAVEQAVVVDADLGVGLVESLPLM